MQPGPREQSAHGGKSSGSSPVLVESRARLSQGRSSQAIYHMVARALTERGVRSATLIDIGCGRGDLMQHVRPLVERYVGVDAVRYETLPDSVEFYQANAEDAGNLAHLVGEADVVTAVETIEHVENPRSLIRLMTRLVRVGGWLLVTTPNQLSALSLLTLLAKGQFNQFQDIHYPAHLSAVLPVDLRRFASEVALSDVAIDYSGAGRIPLGGLSYPSAISTAFPRLCSDNVMLIGRRTA